MKRINLLIVLLLSLGFQSLFSQQEYTATKVFGKEELAVRVLRSSAITGNIGWNGLSGLGVSFRVYPITKVSVEAGLGLATTGFKLGVRGKYLFTDKKFTPTIGAGFLYGTGSSLELTFDATDSQSEFNYKINASPFLQIVGGFEYMSNGGFLIGFDAGYAALLNGTNYMITSGSPTKETLTAMDIALGSGIVLDITIGFAFGR